MQAKGFRVLKRFEIINKSFGHCYLSTKLIDENMSSKIFWEKFYKKHNSESFEWLVEYNKNLDDYIDKNELNFRLTLDVGCGNSIFSSKLFQNRNSFLICADFSSDALNQLQKSTTSTQTVTDFVLCDCTKLPFRADCFNIILDKGYLDSIIKSKDMNLSLNSLNNMLDKLSYTNDSKLDNRNYLIQITDEVPELRIDLFDKLSFCKNYQDISFSFKEIKLNDDDNQSNFIYFVQKNSKI